MRDVYMEFVPGVSYGEGAIVRDPNNRKLYRRNRGDNPAWLEYFDAEHGAILCGMRLYTFVNGTLQPDEGSA